MSDNMCEHGGLDGNCLRCKDATIATLKAEKAQKQLVIDDCKRNLQEQDATITALREEAALYQKEWAILREEVEQLKKELRILYSSNYVQKILGHASIKTTQIYAEVLQEVMQKEMEKLRFE